MKLWNLYFAMSAGDTSSSEQEASISQPVPPAGAAGEGDKAGVLTWFVWFVGNCGTSISCASCLTVNMCCMLFFCSD